MRSPTITSIALSASLVAGLVPFGVGAQEPSLRDFEPPESEAEDLALDLALDSDAARRVAASTGPDDSVRPVRNGGRVGSVGHQCVGITGDIHQRQIAGGEERRAAYRGAFVGA